MHEDSDMWRLFLTQHWRLETSALCVCLGLLFEMFVFSSIDYLASCTWKVLIVLLVHRLCSNVFIPHLTLLDPALYTWRLFVTHHRRLQKLVRCLFALHVCVLYDWLFSLFCLTGIDSFNFLLPLLIHFHTPPHPPWSGLACAYLSLCVVMVTCYIHTSSFNHWVVGLIEGWGKDTHTHIYTHTVRLGK